MIGGRTHRLPFLIGPLLIGIALTAVAAAPLSDGAMTKGTAPHRAPTTDPADPVVASVEGHLIHFSDLKQTEQTLPADLRRLPFASLYPILVDRTVDHQALVMLARQRGLEAPTDHTLEAALLAADVAPKVTEDAIKARYNEVYAGKPPTEQVRARHILVETEAEADKIIEELQQGADFATLAQQDSLDPDGEKGGDLGFFSRAQVWPGFAELAFGLQPGQVADHPIHNEFGWQVVKVEECRLLPPPSYAEAHDALRGQLMQEAVRQEVALARAQLSIHEWNMDGSEVDAGPQPARQK